MCGRQLKESEDALIIIVMGEGDPTFIRLKLVFEVDITLLKANELLMTTFNNSLII